VSKSLAYRAPDASSLRTLFDDQLVKGRAFVPGAGGVPEREKCQLVLEIGAREFRLNAEVVYVKPDEPRRGVGLQLDLEPDTMTRLRAFVEEAETATRAIVDAAEADDGAAADDAYANQDTGEYDLQAKSLYERIRGLSGAEQQRVAMSGTLPERIAVERLFGPSVWDTLLRSGRLTIPEVARIARKGTLPRPLLEHIAANSAWLQAGEVQRALLANPRASQSVIQRVLAALPRHDLMRVHQQTAYSAAVRQAAKRMLSS
jgi:hypothetical protein